MSDPGRGGVFRSETGEQFVQRQDEVGILGEGTALIEQLEPDPRSGTLQPFAVPGVVAQDPPHCLSPGGAETTSAFEVLVADSSQVGLVHKRCGVDGVFGLPRGHSRGRVLAQPVADEWKQVGRCLAVAGRGGVHQVGDLGNSN